MHKRITIIQGHPHPGGQHFVRELAAAYAKAALGAGNELHVIDVATLKFPLLRDADAWSAESVPDTLREARHQILWADHLVIFFPIWLDSMPALLKGFFEQVLRKTNHSLGTDPAKGVFDVKALEGKSARVVVTMDIPAFVFHWYFFAYGLKSLERNILAFAGAAPISDTIIGMSRHDATARAKWLRKLTALGRRGA